MSFCKNLIIVFIVFLLSGEVYAQRAYTFDKNQKGCLGFMFSTERVVTDGYSPVNGLSVVGWYVNNVLVATTDVADIPVEQPSTTAVLRSQGPDGKLYYDTLVIEAVLEPEITMFQNDSSVCAGTVFWAYTDGRSNVDMDMLYWEENITKKRYYVDKDSIPTGSDASFTIYAMNRTCVSSIVRISYNLRIKPLVNSDNMRVDDVIRAQVCPGCTRSLDDFIPLKSDSYDTLILTGPIVWTKDGIAVASPNAIGAPDDNEDQYIGHFVGMLYKENECNSETKTGNIMVSVFISRSHCQLESQWQGTTSKTKTGVACRPQYIDIINPQPDGFTITNTVFTSRNPKPTEFGYVLDQGRGITRYTYTPKGSDTVYIEVTYTNNCDVSKVEIYRDTLIFEAEVGFRIEATFCYADTLMVRVISTDENLSLNSIDFGSYADRFKPPVQYLNGSNVAELTYMAKDTNVFWDESFGVTVNYTTTCGGAQETDTVVKPMINPNCYPTIDMFAMECLGDTNYISVTEYRRPVAYIKGDIEWTFPEDSVDNFGNMDTVWSDNDKRLQYRIKLISYSTTPINYKFTYVEGGRETPHTGTLYNATDLGCDPQVVLSKFSPCRGEVVPLDIRMGNQNGRIEGEVNWWMSPDFGETEVKSLGMELGPDGKAIYHYTIRFQGGENVNSSRMNGIITYTYGRESMNYRYEHTIDKPTQQVSVSTACLPIIERRSIKDLLNNNWDKDSLYCIGDIAPLQVVPKNSEDSIISVDWISANASLITFDSLSPTTSIRYYSYAIEDSGVVQAKVVVKDYWGDIHEYVISTRKLYVRPAPRIFTQDTVGVCEEGAINLLTGGYIATDLLGHGPDGIGWPPSVDNSTTETSLGKDQPSDIRWADAFPKYYCSFMRQGERIKDTITLVKHFPPQIEELELSEDICMNDTLELHTNGFATATYTWVKVTEDGLRDTLYENVEYATTWYDVVSDTATYYATATTACGSKTVFQEIKPVDAPEFNFFARDSVCLYDTAGLISIPSGDIMPNTTVWYLHDSLISDRDTFVLDINDTLLYEIMAMAKGNNGCWGKKTDTIQSLKLPVVDIQVTYGGRVYEDSVICAAAAGVGSGSSLEARVYGAQDYTWMSPIAGTDDFLNVNATGNEMIFKVSGKDVYGCENRDSFYVAVLPDDNVYSRIEVNKDTICIGAAHEITVTEVQNNWWEYPNGRKETSLTLRINEMAVSNEGTYLMVRSLHGCLDTIEFQLKSKPVPDFTMPSNVELCEDTDLNFEATVRYPAEHVYHWETPSATKENSLDIDIPNVQQANAGTYKFWVDRNGCLDSAEMTVRVDARTMPQIQSLAEFYCMGETIQFDYLPRGADSYKLFLPSLSQPLSGATPSITASQSDSGVIMLLVDKQTCRDTVYDTLDIRYRPNPTPSYRSQYCEGDTITVSLLVEQGVSYTWKAGSRLTVNDTNLVLPDVAVSDAQEYELTASTNGCESEPDIFRLTIYPLPAVDIMSEASFVCIGDVLIIETPYRSGATYLWHTNAGETDPSIEIRDSGVYAVTVTENGCEATDSITIEGRAKPKFFLNTHDTMVCVGIQVVFFATLEDTMMPDVYYTWMPNNEQTPNITATESGIYKLLAELNGCSWSDSVRLVGRFCGSFDEMPNAFKPNSSITVNQTFKPVAKIAKELLVYELLIYDRWGKLMFRTTDYDEGWNGTFENKGKACAEGTYVYRINAHETVFGEDLSTMGTVTLIK